MLYRYPINDAHIHVFDPDDIPEVIQMIDWCGYTYWSHLAYTGMRQPLGLVQNLLGALLKLKENGRCRAFASFHYDEGIYVPEAEELARQIEWFDKAGFDGIKMMDGKPGIRVHAYLTEESSRPALPALCCLLLLLLSVMSLAQSGFHPFIYFQF